MKKIIAFNSLLTLVHFPYCFGRWLHIPYISPSYLDEIMLWGAILIAPFLVLNTILLLVFNYKSKKWKAQSLWFNFILLLLSLVYVIYVATVISWEQVAVWEDVLAIGILLIGIRLTKIELLKCNF